MQPSKPYAFVSYSGVDEAMAAMKSVHGSEINGAARDDKIPLKFFLVYVEKGEFRTDWTVSKLFDTLRMKILISTAVCDFSHRPRTGSV